MCQVSGGTGRCHLCKESVYFVSKKLQASPRTGTKDKHQVSGGSGTDGSGWQPPAQCVKSLVARVAATRARGLCSSKLQGSRLLQTALETGTKDKLQVSGGSGTGGSGWQPPAQCVRSLVARVATTRAICQVSGGTGRCHLCKESVHF